MNWLYRNKQNLPAKLRAKLIHEGRLTSRLVCSHRGEIPNCVQCGEPVWQSPAPSWMDYNVAWYKKIDEQPMCSPVCVQAYYALHPHAPNKQLTIF